MVRMMIQLTEEQVRALKELAKARKMPVAKLVRESVAEYIVATPKKPTYEEKRQRALEFLRKLRNKEIQFRDVEGKTDVSVNHDKYLDEAYGSWKKSS